MACDVVEVLYGIQVDRSLKVGGVDQWRRMYSPSVCAPDGSEEGIVAV